MTNHVSQEQIKAARNISIETIRMLVSQKIMYQEKAKNNIVFINAERDFAELRGTYTFRKPFHGIVANCRHDGFWWFRTSKNASTAYNISVKLRLMQ